MLMNRVQISKVGTGKSIKIQSISINNINETQTTTRLVYLIRGESVVYFSFQYPTNARQFPFQYTEILIYVLAYSQSNRSANSK